MEENKIIAVYGENALEEATQAIKDLRLHSNIPFDDNLMKTGVAFIHLKCGKIAKGEIRKMSLHALVSESFGEAAIAIYQT